jgi:hypothetical protein
VPVPGGADVLGAFAVIVHVLVPPGALAAHDPSPAAGQLIFGAGGTPRAVRNASQPDQVPFHNPRSSLTAARA